VLRERLSRICFRACHGRQLVYNTCWEDPRLDQVALDLGPDDRVLVITSAGCNALDYAISAPKKVIAVDVNYRQNALLELKIAGIRNLDYEQFFQLFGRGRLDNWHDVYDQQLRQSLSEPSQAYWDRNGHLFTGGFSRTSFYFRGSAGWFAWVMNYYVDRIAKIRPAIDAALEAESLEEQRAIYLSKVKPAFWGPSIRWLLRRDLTLSMLGVPRTQRRQLDRGYRGGIARFCEDRLDKVFTSMPLRENYFWRVYLTGEYSEDCCPEYLKPDNFQLLKGGLVDRIEVKTSTILDFLTGYEGTISRYVLLDHMDWLSENYRKVLAAQWQKIVDRADEQTRILWRSACLEVAYVDPIEIELDGRLVALGDVLDYQQDLAEQLHKQDRVNTYGSFYIADLNLPGKVAQGGAGASQSIEDEFEHEPRVSAKDAVSSDSLAHSR